MITHSTSNKNQLCVRRCVDEMNTLKLIEELGLMHPFTAYHLQFYIGSKKAVIRDSSVPGHFALSRKFYTDDGTLVKMLQYRRQISQLYTFIVNDLEFLGVHSLNRKDGSEVPVNELSELITSTMNAQGEELERLISDFNMKHPFAPKTPDYI